MERVARKPKLSRSNSMRLPRPLLRVFREPLLLEDEDPDAYKKLFARVRDAVKPVDVIDEIHIADAVQLEWQVLRWRRVEFALIQPCQLDALKQFLSENIEYPLYETYFVDDLRDVLQQCSGLRPDLPECEEVQSLVDHYAQRAPGAALKVDSILHYARTDANTIEQDARARKAEELVQEYLQHKPSTVALINEFLARSGVNIDSLAAEKLTHRFDDIERIQRFITMAEDRRNASLREIERRSGGVR